MKNFLLFILILANNLLYACGFYPYGEATRISLFSPTIFSYHTYGNFNYSSNAFSPNEDSNPLAFLIPNINLWFDYCRGNVDIQAINTAIYQLTEFDIDKHSPNEMIQYLYQQKDNDALNYLRFAKKCEFFNSWQDDPWERQTDIVMRKRTELMNTAIEYANKVHDTGLKNRYTFLAIRLAWYNHHFDKIKLLFTSRFEKTTNKDILYYWSLYFKSLTETDSARANFELAQVFANATDKRFVCHQHYNSTVSVEQTLLFTQTKAEKANVYLLYGIEKPDKALEYLQKMYSLNPASDGLSFLLLREINKIEDFVLTPYYTLFQPSLAFDYWGKHDHISTRQILNRAERDRLYAKEVLQFVNSVDLRKVENPFFWQCCKSYLQFITRDYDACIALVTKLEKSASDDKIINQLQIIKALALTARQTIGHALILPEIQSTILHNKKNGQFIFAIGKEIENLGNTTDAALLYAKIGNNWSENSVVFWKTVNNNGINLDYFVDYFNYADAVYTPAQTQSLIDNILKNQESKDSFAKFKYEDMKNELSRLYDLLGTKYIRQNKLENALASFEKIDNKYWARTYTAWGDRVSTFDQNPFYCLKYTPKFIITKDTIRLNKYSITKQLIEYLRKAESNNEKDRDYYYFLVANAYYNMGQEGNIPMMRRLSGWSRSYLSVIEDEVEFRQTNLAMKYYLLAQQYAKTNKFKALCMRMIIRCEKNKLQYKFFEYESFNGHSYDSLLATNKYYRELHEKYHDYFDDLASNCDNFEAYFGARR